MTNDTIPIANASNWIESWYRTYTYPDTKSARKVGPTLSSWRRSWCTVGNIIERGCEYVTVSSLFSLALRSEVDVSVSPLSNNDVDVNVLPYWLDALLVHWGIGCWQAPRFSSSAHWWIANVTDASAEPIVSSDWLVFLQKAVGSYGLYLMVFKGLMQNKGKNQPDSMQWISYLCHGQGRLLGVESALHERQGGGLLRWRPKLFGLQGASRTGDSSK